MRGLRLLAVNPYGLDTLEVLNGLGRRLDIVVVLIIGIAPSTVELLFKKAFIDEAWSRNT